MKHGPLEYLGRVPFNASNFPELWPALMVAAAALLVLTVVLYNVRVRQLHRFEPLKTMQEWLLWTGLIFFGLLLVEGIFAFYFLFVLATILIGLVTFVWVRFVRFPPMIAGYNELLRRQRFYGQTRTRAEATIRRRGRTQRRR